MKRCIASMLAIMMLLSSFCYAMPLQKKSETVYVNLGDYGEVTDINIYNKCTTNETSNIIDFTNYSEVTNLTNRKEYKSGDGSIIWDVSGEKYFSYTGKVGNEYYGLIPWTFDISYKLNGVETKMSELLGSNGLVEINIDINSNENANDYYKNNYILEITATYDMSKYLSVNSDDAMITETGNSKTLMFIVLPGQSTSLNIEIGSNDFEMDGITMAMVPITGDLLDEIAELVEDKDDIEDAMDSLNKSTDVVLNSLSGMTSGLNGLSNGISEIKNGTKELHGLNTLRDEDIENLNKLLNEMLPIIENVQVDLDNMNSTYGTFIDLADELTLKTKEMSSNVDALNKELKILESMAKDLPDDVKEIRILLKGLSKVTSDLNSLLKSLSNSTGESTKELTDKLNQIATETAKIGATVQNVYPNVSDEETRNALLGIGNSANTIGENLSDVEVILKDMSTGMSGTSTMSKDLKELSSQLNVIANILDEDDAEIFEDMIKDIRKVSETLEDMLDIATKYSDKILEDKDNFYIATDNMKQLVNELKEMNTLSLSMISNIQNMLNILSNSIYNGAEKTTDALLDVNNQLITITKQSSEFKNSKNEIKDIVDNKWDDVEGKTNLFNVTKDAEVVSFGNSKNENVSSVQFVLKTPDIKKIKEENNDFEVNQKPTTFWDRIILVFSKMFGWIGRIFS